MKTVRPNSTEAQGGCEPSGDGNTFLLSVDFRVFGCSPILAVMFCWSEQYYKKIRGLAMDQRLAPTPAIALMLKTEQPVLDRRSILYVYR